MPSDTRVIHAVQTLKLRPEVPSDCPRVSFFKILTALLASSLYSFFFLVCISYFFFHYSRSAHNTFLLSLPFIVIFFHCRKEFANIIRECWRDDAVHRPTSLRVLEKLEAAIESFASSIPASVSGPSNNRFDITGMYV